MPRPQARPAFPTPMPRLFRPKPRVAWPAVFSALPTPPLRRSRCAATGAAALRRPAGARPRPERRGVVPVPPLTFLHVVTPAGGPDRTPYLADAAGREVLLHGVAAVGMEDVAYPERQRRAGALPGLALRLRRPVPQGLAAHSSAAALRDQAAQARLPAVDRTGQRRRLRPDAGLGLQRRPPGPQLEPTRASAGRLLRHLSRSRGPGGRLGAPAGHLPHPRHAPGPVLALHPPGRTRHRRPRGARPLAAATVRPAGRSWPRANRAARSTASTSSTRPSRPPSPTSGRTARSRDRRGRRRAPVSRITTSVRWPPWPTASRTTPPCSATS